MREPRLDLLSLRARLSAVAPHALLVSEQLVRRVVRRVRGVTGVSSFVPHTHALAVEVQALRAAVDTRELAELGELGSRDGWVLLVTVPDEHDLRETWRRLFHARVDEELGRLVAAGALGPARVRELIDAVGQVPMDEARQVLREEGLVAAQAGPTEELVELVALYEELRLFAPGLLPHTFPSLGTGPRFAELVDGDALFTETRFEGVDSAEPTDGDARPAPAGQQVPPPPSPERWAEGLRALGEEDHESWSPFISRLSSLALAGMASVEARLLHDLRRACQDGHGELTSLDLGRSIRSALREPMRRREVVRQKVAVARHLARALRRLPETRLSEAERRRGRRLLEPLTRRHEELVRREVGALLEEGLSHSRLIPRDIPEEVSREKLVAELCDRLLDKGFIAFADVRDQIARNRLKLDDLSAPELVRDALLRFDRFLNKRLGGAYRAAEVYRRFFHRVSSLVFANPVGRLVVRYAALPFGGAYVLVKGFDLVILSLVGMLLGLEPVPPPPGSPPGTPHDHALQVFSLPLMLAVGVVLFLLLHAPGVRRLTVRALRELGRGLRFVFVALPRRFVALPWVRRLVETRAFRLLYDHLWRPLLYAAPPTLVVVAVVGDARLWLWCGVPLTLAWSLFFATWLGRRFTEAARDWAITKWRELRHDIVPGLISAVLELFRAVVDRVEVVLYSVDQRLRYLRGGTSGAWTGLRAVVGLLWSVLAYLVRLVINLVAEPQLNPIKHFPVVTIAHKITIPWSIAVHQSLKELGMSEAAASLIGLGAFQLAVPGIAGFLVWELKENWRLYRANMPPELGPVVVGAHGEPVYRFLRPGFHSGTVPTLFKKLRKAEKKGRAALARRHLEALHHVEVAMERLFLREVRMLLVRSGQLPEASELRVEHVTLTPGRVALDLGCPPLGAETLRLAFEEQSGLLVAAVVEPGFLGALGEPSAPRRVAFATAMMALYKLAGVDLVRGHIRSALPPGAAFDISERGLVVWEDGFARERVYPLTFDRPALVPEDGGPPIPTTRVAFKQRVVRWDDWRRAWEGPAATRAMRDRVMGEQLLLPRV